MKKIFTLVLIAATAMAMTACANDPDPDPDSKPEPEPKPAAQVSPENAEAPASLRIYIDNSGSMKGYTEYLSEKFYAPLNELCAFPNSEMFFWGDKKPIEYNSDKPIAQTFSNYSFPGADTPFPTIFENIVKDIDTTGRLEFIVTDGIISLKANQQKYLESSLGQIKQQISKAIGSSPDIAVCVYRLMGGYSNDKGPKDLYYTCQVGKSVKLKDANRPFFVIAFGKRANIQWLIEQIETNKAIKPALANAEYLAFGIHKHDTALKMFNSKYFSGNEKNMKLKYVSGSFTIKPDLPPCLFANMTDEEIQKGIELLVNGQPDDVFSIKVRNNRLELKCSNIGLIKKPKNTITIKLKNSIPEKWLTTYSSNNDLNIKDDIVEQTRTYALETLLQGIFEATDVNKLLIDAEMTFSK